VGRTDPFAMLPPTFSALSALADGLTREQLRSERLHRPTRELYVVRRQAPGLTMRLGALLELLPRTAVFSHGTAAMLLGLPDVGRGTATHVTVAPGGRAPQRRGVIAHRSTLLADDMCHVDGLAVTTPARTFVDMAASLHLDYLVALGDAILRLGPATGGTLRQRVGAAGGQRGVRRAREALLLLDGRSDSVPESVIRVRIIGAGLPTPVPQCLVRDHAGRPIARLDLGLPEHRLGVDYDGRVHAEPGQFGKDLRRHTLLVAAGWRVLRAGAADLRDGSVELITTLSP